MAKGSSWGERCAQAPEEAQTDFKRSCLAKCGAKPRSTDVHWPMTLSLRVPVVNADGVQLRSSGLSCDGGGWWSEGGHQ